MIFFFQTVEEHSGSGFVTGDPGFPIKRENGKFSYFINKFKITLDCMNTTVLFEDLLYSTSISS